MGFSLVRSGGIWSRQRTQSHAVEETRPWSVATHSLILAHPSLQDGRIITHASGPCGPAWASGRATTPACPAPCLPQPQPLQSSPLVPSLLTLRPGTLHSFCVSLSVPLIVTSLLCSSISLRSHHFARPFFFSLAFVGLCLSLFLSALMYVCHLQIKRMPRN